MAIGSYAWHSASSSTGEKMATLESLQVKIKKLERQAEALIAKQSISPDFAICPRLRKIWGRQVQLDPSRYTHL
jgi:hypothetical protein